MARCKFVSEEAWMCPLEAEPGEDYCYWHKREDGKSPTKEQLEVLKKEKIIGVYLRKAKLQLADLQGAFLYGANLQGANLFLAKLQGAELNKANLQGANLRDANLRKATLEGTNLQEADLEFVYSEKANFARANLERVKLRGANLQGTNLKEANIERANLEYAKLNGAILVRANLKKAYLRQALLEGANLSGANIGGADLSRAVLTGANLEGVKTDQETDLTGTLLNYSNLFFSYIDETKTLRNAIFISKTEINEIVADLLRKKNSKIVVLDANRIEKEKSDLCEFLKRKGIIRYTTKKFPPFLIMIREEGENNIFLFNRRKNCFVSDWLLEDCIEIATHEVEIEEIAEHLDKYLLQNPPEVHTVDPKNYKKGLIIKLYGASYNVFNMLYYFYIQNGKLDEAFEMHRRRSDVRRKILMVMGGWDRLRAIFYDWFILKFLTGYGLNVLKPILFSLITIITFAFLFWITGGIVKIVNGIPYKPDFWDYLYHSVITFTSLGYSNIVPNLEIGHLAQFLVAAESILGVLLIALIIFTITYRISK